ncbi:hypothetical protein [Pedobacter sp. Hv1]|uniref:hypothetical protein n=1 Tax=Pedobacter sp. Hv1 TaxID=1740090 RepID=UPI0006D8AB1E|nr:hypothetical protein [Pedobacter sp. Hv1]KQC00960.1 hypothetical protein AQF98_09825 [Pedobacter sp. Hv1]
MKKANLLSKAEMKKVNGGTDPIGLCTPQIHCVNDQGNTVMKFDVPDCETFSIGIACSGVIYSASESFCVPCP